ncbi:DNA repair protein RecN [Aristophania vespae]|uniref:DNA repair protein RecN n=1 Tax=Aristophania vespae TaxID=2697033 RepID=UPI0023518B5A|nr:DNA repair protein RecN [Aristophania vespae]UMM63455.1 DNA repair protein RecN [Aristophania vespae]
MLTQLSIRDIVLIEKLDLNFHDGLTVFTGETGAGKSILLDSLGLALGERASGNIIRTGAEQSSVTAVFDLPPHHAVFQVLQELDLSCLEEEPLVLRRLITKDGRSRAYIGDQLVGISVLRKIAALLVEIQGQHEQMGLADQRVHLDLLDAFGSLSHLTQRVNMDWKSWQQNLQTLAEARKAIDQAAREENWLRQTIEELSSLAPQEGEEEQLVALRLQLQQEERRREAVTTALAELTPRDRKSAHPAHALRSASRALARLLPSPLSNNVTEEPTAHQVQAQEALSCLEKAEETLAEAEMLLSRLVADTEVDNRLLEETEERLFSLRAEARKHHLTLAELPHFLTELKDRLSKLETGIEAIHHLEQAAKQAQSNYEASSQELSQGRRKAAKDLEKAIMAELKPLKLERAQFMVEFTSLPFESWSQRGVETVSFLIAANPGQPAGPLGKVASGGELSRLMLALKVVLAGRSSLTTLVFDEVDSGVGGATASAIGERLYRVAQDVQVLAITHSPQVAAQAAHQFRIEKKVLNQSTVTIAAPLSPTERREEIARMLAGDIVTDAARIAADSLLGQKP